MDFRHLIWYEGLIMGAWKNWTAFLPRRLNASLNDQFCGFGGSTSSNAMLLRMSLWSEKAWNVKYMSHDCSINLTRGISESNLNRRSISFARIWWMIPLHLSVWNLKGKNQRLDVSSLRLTPRFVARRRKTPSVFQWPWRTLRSLPVAHWGRKPVCTFTCAPMCLQAHQFVCSIFDKGSPFSVLRYASANTESANKQLARQAK